MRVFCEQCDAIELLWESRLSFVRIVVFHENVAQNWETLL
jgi:hypothetical protein